MVIIFKIIYLNHGSGLEDIADIVLSERYVWFIWMIIGIYLFLPVVNSFIREFGMQGARYFVVIWLITALLRTFGWYPFGDLELSYFAGYLGYFVFGYWLNNENFRLHDKTLMKLGLCIFLISALTYNIVESIQYTLETHII